MLNLDSHQHLDVFASMSRKPVAPTTQTTVLVRSRRRCCICFGLNRDLALKSGQIAHLDQDNTNSAEDNLAFLCLDHHDEYDSRTSQRKGLTIGEVKVFRSELYGAVDKVLAIPVHFGEIAIPAEDPYAGQYIAVEVGENASAEITLTPLGDGMEGCPRYAVTGFALVGIDREYGPNMGEMEFIAVLRDGEIEYEQESVSAEAPHTVRLMFANGSLIVEERNEWGMYGNGVTFNGRYLRAN